MEILLCILWSLLFILLIQRMRFFETKDISRHTISFFFIIKVLAGVALWAVYTFYYTDRSTADIYKYFDDSRVIHSALRHSARDYFNLLFGTGSDRNLQEYILKMNYWYREFESNIINEDRTMIRFNAVLQLFSFGYFNVHTVFFSFLSLCGLAGIYKTFAPALEGKRRTFAILLFLFPSLLFWCSGVLKESLVLFTAGMLIYHFNKLLSDKKPKSFLFSFLFACLLLITKSYMLLVLVPGLLCWLIIHLTGNHFSLLKFALAAGICVTAAFTVHKLGLPERIVTKQKMFVNVANGGTHLLSGNKFVYISPEVNNPVTPTGEKGYARIRDGVPYQYWFREKPNDTLTATAQADTTSYWVFYSQPPSGSRISIAKLDERFTSFLKAAPQAFGNVMLRPYMWEARSPLLIVPALENVFLVVLLALAILFGSYKQSNKAILFFCLSSFVFLFLLVGYTTPVMGAIVRYKTPALPFLFVFQLILINKEKIKKYPLLRFIT